MDDELDDDDFSAFAQTRRIASAAHGCQGGTAHWNGFAMGGNVVCRPLLPEGTALGRQAQRVAAVQAGASARCSPSTRWRPANADGRWRERLLAV